MKKIMFSDKYGLTQAVLEGRKTQTRRIAYMPNEFIIFDDKDFQLKKLDNGQALLTLRNNSFKTARYKIGEEVAIAQKYADLAYDGEFFRLLGKVIFEKGCHNKMFVKADFMPHRIRITNIRVERLQDISDEDVIHEGFSNICFNKNMGNMLSEWYYDLSYYDAFGNSQSLHSTIAKEAYSYLIAKIYGWSLWDSNPWVFVYDFELVK